MEGYVRSAKHAGEWYPAEPDKLTEMIKAAFYYAECPKEHQERVCALIAPHSAYDVCLRTGALAYTRVNPDNFDKVVILGTCHLIPLAGLLVSGASELETPLGSLCVDVETCATLVSTCSDLVSFMTRAQDEAEYSIEQQLPLLKFVFESRGVKIVPILVGCLSEEREARLSELLKPICTEQRVLIVVSSDFMHWGVRFRFTNLASERHPLVDQLRLYDERALDLITAFSYSHFRFFFDEIKGAICGCRAINLLLRLLETGHEAQCLGRSELCPLASEKDWSVSWAAVVFRVVEEVKKMTLLDD